MHRFVWITVVWVVASSTFISFLCVSAAELDRPNHVNGFLGKRNKRPSLVPNDGSTNALSHRGNMEFVGVDNEVEGKVSIVADDENDDNEAGNENEISDLARVRRKYRLTDILVACFFFVAAIWLILACIYSVILLVLLRLQARGELDIYDENLGRVVLYNGRVTLHFGCILRRYAIQLEEDYQRQLQRRFGDANAEDQNEEPQRIRIMTREERRKAVEELLGSTQKVVDVESRGADEKRDCNAGCNCDKIESTIDASQPLPADTSFACSDEGPICSICLVEYEPTDFVFKSKSCPHMFHGNCLFSWLERRNNTECPICREVLVSDDDIWDAVQRMRKQRRKQLQYENGAVHRFVRWIKSRRSRCSQSPVENDRPPSLTSLSDGTDIHSSSSAASEVDAPIENDDIANEHVNRDSNYQNSTTRSRENI